MANRSSVRPAPFSSSFRPIIARTASSFGAASRTAVGRVTSLLASDKAKPLEIVCSPTVFRLVWLVLNTFQFALFLTLIRALYSYIWTLRDHDEIVAALRQFGLEFNSRVMMGSVVLTVINMALHFNDVTHSVRCSIRRRQLVLRDPGHNQTARTDSVRSPWWHRRSIQCPAWLQPKFELVRRVAYECDVHGNYFDVGLYAREILEISLQTYQTYRVSYTVGESWINSLAVGVVVVNCWTTPLLDLYLYYDEPQRRIMCLVIDIVLDAVAGLVLPFLVYASWRSKVPLMDWYNPMWIMDAVNDLMFFHVNTWIDLVSRLMPAASMIHCIHAIRAALKPPASQSQHSASTPSMVVVVPQPRKPSTKHPTPAPPQPRRRIALIHALMFIYGAVVLAMGVLARNGPHLTPVLAGCQKSTRPWLLLNAKYPCAVMELNCLTDPQLTEEDSGMDNRLAQADTSTLAALIITHCPRVRMPPRLASFRYLLWFEIYNSTLMEWPETAALTQTLHPLLSRVLFVRGGVEPATLTADMLLERLVLSPSLPRTLLDVAIVASNLSTISRTPPTILAATPRSLLTLVMEQCEMPVTPSLPSVRVASLSLAQNPITNLQLAAVHATEILLQSTSVARCSSASSVLLHAAGSPLCGQSVQDRTASCPPPVTIDCTTQRLLFPLQSLDARRRRV